MTKFPRLSLASQTGTCLAPARLTGMVSFTAGQAAHGITWGTHP